MTTKVRHTFIVDKRLVAAIKIKAVREETTISSIIDEALATWLKWMARAEREEQSEIDREREIEEAERIRAEVIEERRLLKQRMQKRKYRARIKKEEEREQ